MLISKNKKQLRNYEIIESLEVGIQLTGSEVKSIRAGHVDLSNSYCTIYKNELFLDEAYIKEYMLEKTDPTRRRKLLAHKREIKNFKLKAEKQSLTIIVKSMYWSRGNVKCDIALARGLRKYDKRQKLIEDEVNKKIAKKIKDYL